MASPAIHDLGAWLEQLVAESTGKDGKAIIPVDREPLGAPAVYGADRIFVYQRLTSAPDAAQDRAIDALAAAGHPVIRIAMDDAYDLGREFFRWEFATAVAGAIIGINPFNQPDVEASKIATKKLTSEFEATGSLPAEAPGIEEDGIKVFGPTVGSTLADSLRAHLNSIQADDYFALLAYIEMNPAHEAALTAMRQRVRDAKRVATCLGFGPRFLHSTGQAYKGGPNSGVFLQITADDAHDVAIPGAEVHFRHRQSGAGAGRSDGSARTRPARAADSSGRGRGRGAGKTRGGRWSARYNRSSRRFSPRAGSSVGRASHF